MLTENPASASGVLIGGTASGAAFQIMDAMVSMVQVKVFDPTTDAVIFDSGKISGHAVRWNADLEGSMRYRISVQGWNAENELLVHHIKSTTGAAILAVNFDTIPTGLKLLGPGGPIVLDGDVNVNGGIDIVSGLENTITDTSPAANTLSISALTDNPGRDILEIDALASLSGQYMEFESDGGGIEHQINIGGEAWFGDQSRPLPAFLPIAFGFVESDGSIASGSDTFSAVWNAGSSRYELTFPGYTYFYNNFTTIISPSPSSRICATNSSGGVLWVTCYTTAGTPTATGFQFVTYFNPVDAIPEGIPAGGGNGDAP